MISELRVLGGDAVIAKDVDSKRQLTEPLKSFIYAPEPAGRRRGKRQSEGEGRQECTTSKKKKPYCFEVQPSHLISVAGDRGDCERLTAEALARSCSIKGQPRGEVQF